MVTLPDELDYPSDDDMVALPDALPPDNDDMPLVPLPSGPDMPLVPLPSGLQVECCK